MTRRLTTELPRSETSPRMARATLMEFERDDGRFRTEVFDQGDGLIAPLRDRGDPDTPGGWGLPLVRTLSDRWGAHEGSTHVWFEFAL